MRKIRVLGLLAVALLLGGTYACDSSNPVAPPGATLTITASPTLIAISGGSSTITVRGFRPDGNPLNPGTQIRFTTSLGTLSETLVEVDDFGSASTRLVSSGQSGMATVTASTTAADIMAEIMITIGDDDTSRPMLTVTATPSEIDLNQPGQIVVDVRNADGSPFGAGGAVMLTTSLGCFGTGTGVCPTQTTVMTDNQSRATSPFFSGNEVGTAAIQAFLGSATGETMVTIENQQPQLLITANPSIIGTGGNSFIQILARDENGTPLDENERIRLVSDLGVLRARAGDTNIITSILTDSNGEAIFVFEAGNRSGTGQVTATLGTSDPATVDINIRAAVDSVSLDVSPRNIQITTEGEEITLIATVLDTQANLLAGVQVEFDPEFGTFPSGSGGTVVTNAQGRATETLLVTRQDLATLMGNSFTITAIARSEGEEARDTQTVNVQVGGVE